MLDSVGEEFLSVLLFDFQGPARGATWSGDQSLHGWVVKSSGSGCWKSCNPATCITAICTML
jgi:hypothetical protein